MQSARALALLALVACGDDGGSQRIDSGMGSDAGPPVCAAATIGATDVTDEDKDRYITYSADIGEVNGFPTVLRMRFRHTTEQIVLPATLDIAAGTANKSYESCFACFLAVSTDPSSGSEVAYYFQESGTVNFTGDPLNNRHLTMSLESLKLQEATFDGTTATIDATGDCLTLSGSVDQDNVPNAWTCTATDYYALNNNDCQCACGAYDPDCRVPTVATVGCTTGMPVCVPGTTGPTCVDDVMNDTCTDSMAISPGTVTVPNIVNGTSLGAKHHYDRGLEGVSCTGSAKPGPDVVYRAVLTQGVMYTVLLSGLTHDGSIAIVGPTTNPSTCSTQITSCIAGKDSGGAGANENFTFTPPATDQYYFIIDSKDRDGAGAFSLSITAL